MALTWSVENVENQDEVCWRVCTEDLPMHGMKKGESYLSPVTNALIWHSLNTGIGTITEESAAEVYARVSFVEMLYGASLMGPEGPVFITKEDIERHVGLRTNASFKTESRTSFLKRHASSKLDDSVRFYKQFAATKSERDTEALAETLAS
jgi:hypothetical protein